MSMSAVRARILVTLGAVSGITGGVAKVHDYFRHIADEKTLKDLCVGSSGRLHTWFISLAEGDPFITENPQGAPGRGIAQEFGRYTFVLRGYLAHNDELATEKTFQDQVEAVINAFRQDKKLGDTVIDSGPLQWTAAPYRMFAGVLCHTAELVLRVKERTG